MYYLIWNVDRYNLARYMMIEFREMLQSIKLMQPEIPHEVERVIHDDVTVYGWATHCLIAAMARRGRRSYKNAKLHPDFPVAEELAYALRDLGDICSNPDVVSFTVTPTTICCVTGNIIEEDPVTQEKYGLGSMCSRIEPMELGYRKIYSKETNSMHDNFSGLLFSVVQSGRTDGALERPYLYPSNPALPGRFCFGDRNLQMVAFIESYQYAAILSTALDAFRLIDIKNGWPQIRQHHMCLS
jgi:hypothetical protein